MSFRLFEFFHDFLKKISGVVFVEVVDIVTAVLLCSSTGHIRQGRATGGNGAQRRARPGIAWPAEVAATHGTHLRGGDARAGDPPTWINKYIFVVERRSQHNWL